MQYEPSSGGWLQKHCVCLVWLGGGCIAIVLVDWSCARVVAIWPPVESDTEVRRCGGGNLGRLVMDRI